MAQVFMRFPGGKQRALTFSYDDGVEQDVRLIEIFRKYGLKATFNLNSGLYAPEGTVYPEGQVHRRMTESQVSELYRGDDIEVAVHGYTHPWLDHMPDLSLKIRIISWLSLTMCSFRVFSTVSPIVWKHILERLLMSQI